MQGMHTRLYFYAAGFSALWLCQILYSLAHNATAVWVFFAGAVVVAYAGLSRAIIYFESNILLRMRLILFRVMTAMGLFRSQTKQGTVGQ